MDAGLRVEPVPAVARERHEADARAARIEPREHAPRRGDLRGEDRVAPSVRPARARRRSAEPRLAHHAVAVHVAAGRLGVEREVSITRITSKRRGAPRVACARPATNVPHAVDDTSAPSRGYSIERSRLVAFPAVGWIRPLRLDAARAAGRLRGRRGRCERGEAAALPAVERLAQRVEHAADRRREHAHLALARHAASTMPTTPPALRGEHGRAAPAVERGRGVELDLDPLAVAAVILPTTSCSFSCRPGPEQPHARPDERRGIGRERAHAARLAREQEHREVLAHRGIVALNGRPAPPLVAPPPRRARATGQHQLDALRPRERLGREARAPCPPPRRPAASPDSRKNTTPRASRAAAPLCVRRGRAIAGACALVAAIASSPALATARIIERRTPPPRPIRRRGAHRARHDRRNLPQLNAKRSVPRAYLRLWKSA